MVLCGPMQLQLTRSNIRSLIPAQLGRIAEVILPVLVLWGLVAAGFLNHPSVNDEAFYIPYIQNYADESIVAPIQQMNHLVSSQGPAYYMLVRVWTGVVGSTDVQIRLFSVVCMTAAYLYWIKIGQILRLKQNLAHNLTFLILPFYTTISICALSEPIMLLLEFAGLYAWLSGKNHLENGDSAAARRDFCLCGFLLAIAINTRPPAIFISPALAIIGWVRLKNRWAFWGPLIGTLVQIPFWISWGNLFPPTQRIGMMPQYRDLTGLFPDTSIHLLTSAGLFLWPALKIPKNNRKTWWIAVCGLLLWIVAGPVLAPYAPERFRFAGPMLRIGYFGEAFRLAYVVPFLVGWFLLIDSARKIIWNETSPEHQALMLMSILTLAGLLRSPLAFERYVTLFLAFWYLAYAQNFEKRTSARLFNGVAWLVLSLIMIYRVMHPPG